jgi:hypothetical protein
MTDYLARLHKDIFDSKLAKGSLVVNIIVPILTWVIVTKMDFDLFFLDSDI